MPPIHRLPRRRRRDHEAVRVEVEDRVIRPAGLGTESRHFVAVPVQMIEAWILADIESAGKMFKSWRPGPGQTLAGVVRRSEA